MRINHGLFDIEFYSYAKDLTSFYAKLYPKHSFGYIYTVLFKVTWSNILNSFDINIQDTIIVAVMMELEFHHNLGTLILKSTLRAHFTCEMLRSLYTILSQVIFIYEFMHLRRCPLSVKMHNAYRWVKVIPHKMTYFIINRKIKR